MEAPAKVERPVAEILVTEALPRVDCPVTLIEVTDALLKVDTPVVAVTDPAFTFPVRLMLVPVALVKVKVESVSGFVTVKLVKIP